MNNRNMLIGLLLELKNDINKISLINLIKALLCSFLNLSIYLFIAIFIIGFSQGYVIPVDLYMGNASFSFIFNLFTFHILLYFLAMIMSLYPTYIFAILFERRQGKFYDSKCFGLIYYGFEKKKRIDPPIEIEAKPFINEEEKEYKALEFTEKLVRKFLGVSLFNVWSWLIVYVYCHHQINDKLEYSLIFINAIFTLLFFFGFWYYSVKIKSEIDNKLISPEKYKILAETFHRWHAPLFIFLVSTLCLFVHLTNWSFTSIILQLGICLLMGIYLIIFRTFRKRIDKFSNIVHLLSYFRKFGILALIYLIAINFSSSLSEISNPLNIILLYFLAFYTIAIMGIKIYLFLKVKNKPTNGEVKSNSISLGLFKVRLKQYKVLFFIGFAYFIYASTHGNGLHKLNPIPFEKQITLEEFYSSYKSVQKNSPILYAAYGGGLKAHYWNLMILDRLEKSDRFNDIIAMSGVSGGGMGIGNYTATQILDFTDTEMSDFVSKLRSSNILGIELSWLFGKDLIRSYFPARIKISKDRSYRSMKFYTEKLIAPELLDKLSFIDAYSALFERKTYYPNIIINSTSTKDKYGVISAVHSPSSFPGAINLLDITQGNQSLSLSYFEALSTCNRFPIISPAANIPTKGHFLDGGYFENSGILSLLSFKNEIQRFERADTSLHKQSIFNEKTSLISVRNDKLHYLQSLIADANIDEFTTKNNHLSINENLTEIEAIIGGIASLERLPFYLKDMLEEYQSDQFNFINLDLPFYIELDELNQLLQGELTSEMQDLITPIVRNSNESILKLLGQSDNEYDLAAWGVIDPPTARILSKPVEIYMELMMQHPTVKAKLNSLTNIGQD